MFMPFDVIRKAKRFTYCCNQAARHRMSYFDIVYRKALISAAVLFYQTPILLHRAAAARQMYTTGSVVDYTRYSHSAFSPTPPLIFTGSKSVKFDLDLRHTRL